MTRFLERRLSADGADGADVRPEVARFAAVNGLTLRAQGEHASGSSRSAFSAVQVPCWSHRVPRWLGVCVAGAIATVAVQAAVITEATRTYTVGYTLGDLVDPPVTFEQTVTDSTITSLTEVRVGLHLVGVSPGAGWASEMYVSLNRDLTATSVLLNGVGITTLDPVGFGYDGWNVTFRDGATAGDVHAVNLGSGVMVGEVEPDGRLDATDTARSSMLSVFVGGTGNGVWRLSVADLAVGGQMQLVSWSLTLSGASPIPETGVLGGVGLVVLGAVGVGWWRKKSFNHRTSNSATR